MDGLTYTKQLLNFMCIVYVQHKVRIGTILKLYLPEVRIPTLSADSRIEPDNSRIGQGVFYSEI